MTLDFQWDKLRLPAETWTLLNRAVDSLNQSMNVNFHIIKHPFGKIIACQIADVWLFHVGDGGRPPRIWTLALAANPGQRLLLPAQRAEDFDECCDLLQLQGEAQRTQFKNFLTPNSGRALTSTPQGAF